MAMRPDSDESAAKQLWKRLGDTRVGMLWVKGSGQHPQPMSHFPSEDDGAIWFITASDTDLAGAIDGNVDALFIYQSEKGDYQASIKGALEISQDHRKLDNLWSAPIAAWFEQGRQDPRVRLLKFSPKEAAIWASDANPILVGLKLLRASVDDDRSPPDVGSHRVFSFDSVA